MRHVFRQGFFMVVSSWKMAHAKAAGRKPRPGFEVVLAV
jgi:hypothetical protein